IMEKYKELFSLHSENIGENGVYFPMNQTMRTVIPLLLDERAQFNILDGIALYGDTDPGSIDLPPSLPLSPANQYVNNFSQYSIEGAPADWTSIWGEGTWLIKDNPLRLNHTSSGSDRNGYTWNEVGEVVGDLELSAVVRASRENGKLDTVFQLGFNM